MRQSIGPRPARALLVAAVTSVFAMAGQAAAQSLTSPPPSPSVAPALLGTAIVPTAPATPAATPVVHSLMLDQRAVGLARRSDSAPAPVLKRESGSTRANTAMMIVGAAAVVLGAAIGSDAGTVLIIGGAGIGLFGLYRFLN